MDGAKFVIEATEAEQKARDSGLSILQLLPTLLPSAQPLARPSISKFQVAAAGLGSDGRIYLGVNLEFPGAPLHHSVHAEQFLVTNLAVHGVPRLIAFAVSAAPCGHCRQFLQELRHASDDLPILIASDESPTFKPLSSLLPSPFGPFDLLDKKTPFLLEPHDNGLLIAANACNGECESDSDSKLEAAALSAANNSHSPYSGCPSGVALMDCEGKIYKGSYTESAAYNPSLGPVQAALVAYVAGDGGGYEKIVAGVLVEKEGVVVRQEDTARLLLKLASPKCKLRVFHCASALTPNGRMKASI